MQVVSFSSKFKNGKTTVVKELCDIFEGIKFSFGDAVKEECSEIFNIPLELFYSEEGKNTKFLRTIELPNGTILGPKEFTVREILQLHGTDIRRVQDEDYWVKIVRDKILKLENEMDAPLCVFIDDVRFHNEANMIKGLSNNYIIRIEDRPGKPHSPFKYHPSETSLDKYKEFDAKIYPIWGDISNMVNFVTELLDDAFVAHPDRLTKKNIKKLIKLHRLNRFRYIRIKEIIRHFFLRFIKK